jgi:hypothetical protein
MTKEPLVTVETAQVFALSFGIQPAESGVEPQLATAEGGLARLLEFDGPDGIFRHLVAQAAAVLDLLFFEIKVEFLMPCGAAGAEDDPDHFGLAVGVGGQIVYPALRIIPFGEIVFLIPGDAGDVKAFGIADAAFPST